MFLRIPGFVFSAISCYIRNMTAEKIRELLQLAVEASFKAAEAILEVYETPFKVSYKSDKSPVTQADKKANAVIEKMLEPTGIPALTEEGNELPFNIRKELVYLWIVDPLDGTKEFVKRNGEFTVNIALVENGKPVIGVIYSPVMKDLYFAAKGIGAYKTNRHKVIELHNSGKAIQLNELIAISDKLPFPAVPKNYTVVASRSHLSSELYQYIKKLEWEKGKVDLINTGSSIKMCLVAEGSAQEYPRFGDTMEWDTCAGQCIVEEAGGILVDMQTKLPVQYNRENLRNPSFLAKNTN